MKGHRMSSRVSRLTPAPRAAVCHAMAARAPHLTHAPRLALTALDALFIATMATCLWSALATPALAYADPSVMTYTIQALAGVAVALSAVLGVVWRRARRWLLRAMHVDENAGKAAEPAAHAVDASDTEAHTAAGAAARKLTEPRKPFAPDLSWRSRLVLALIAALCVYRLLQEVVLNGNLPAADGTPVDWTIYDKVNLKSALAWLAVVAAFVALARPRPLASRVASVAACQLIAIA